MKAAVVHAPDQAPRYETFAVPEGAQGVAVDVLAAALSPRSRSAASGRHYTSRGVFPLVPGVDGVGRLANGQRVYFLAADDKLGTMAEKTLADPRLLAPVPDGVDASVIAAAMIPAISSWVALTKRVPFERGQSVLVLGATGASGQLAVQIAKRLGAGRVVAAGRNPEALDRAQSLGASDLVRLTGTAGDEDALAAAASEVDVVLDYLWGTVTTRALPALCRRRNDDSGALHWVLIGAVAGEDITLSSTLLRKRNLHILGSGQGATSTADMFSVVPDILAAFAAKELEACVREVPLSDVEACWSANARSGERIVFTTSF
jgi:NADPH:quinone reductase-like Zn-dependent oxidoreductase